MCVGACEGVGVRWAVGRWCIILGYGGRMGERREGDQRSKGPTYTDMLITCCTRICLCPCLINTSFKLVIILHLTNKAIIKINTSFKLAIILHPYQQMNKAIVKINTTPMLAYKKHSHMEQWIEFDTQTTYKDR